MQIIFALALFLWHNIHKKRGDIIKEKYDVELHASTVGDVVQGRTHDDHSYNCIFA